jgi:hypothetical protein
MYWFSQQELEQIRQLIAAKTQPQAVRILLGLPEIQRAPIEEIRENRSLPNDSSISRNAFCMGEARLRTFSGNGLLE